MTEIKSFKDISSEIEQLVVDLEIDYIDAALHYCSENDLEIDFLGELIAKNPNLKAKIELEAENLNFLKKTARLPI